MTIDASKRNRDFPAKPCQQDGTEYDGLTKREAAAIAAMQAYRSARPDWHQAAIAVAAMDDADALFDELEKSDDH